MVSPGLAALQQGAAGGHRLLVPPGLPGGVVVGLWTA